MDSKSLGLCNLCCSMTTGEKTFDFSAVFLLLQHLYWLWLGLARYFWLEWMTFQRKAIGSRHPGCRYDSTVTLYPWLIVATCFTATPSPHGQPPDPVDDRLVLVRNGYFVFSSTMTSHYYPVSSNQFAVLLIVYWRAIQILANCSINIIRIFQWIRR